MNVQFETRGYKMKKWLNSKLAKITLVQEIKYLGEMLWQLK